MLARFQRLRVWAWEMPGVWVSLAFIAVTFQPLLWHQLRHEQYIRYWGLFLQIVAIVCVYFELRRTARDFGKPGLRAALVAWWASRGPRNLTMNAGGANITLGSVFVGGRATGTVSPTATIEDRLKSLEEKMAVAHGAIDALRGDLGAETRARKSDMRAEEAARKDGDQQLADQLAHAATGNLLLAKFGVAWLLVGVVLATSSQELAKCVAKLPAFFGN